jgi:hypothetical protein
MPADFPACGGFDAWGGGLSDRVARPAASACGAAEARLARGRPSGRSAGWCGSLSHALAGRMLGAQAGRHTGEAGPGLRVRR